MSRLLDRIKAHIIFQATRIKNELLLFGNRHFCKIKIMSAEETLDNLIKSQVVLARFGDGELRVILEDHNIGYQPYSALLKEKLSNVLLNHDDKVLVCLPEYVIDESTISGDARAYWHSFCIRYRKGLFRLLRKTNNCVFGSSMLSRPYLDIQNIEYAERIFDKWKQLWDSKDLLIIEGEKTRLGVGNDLFDNAKSIKRILAPAKDAFSVYDQICQAVDEIYNGELILLALGPAATCMAKDFAEKGYRAIDIGHIDIEYEWYLRRATKKEAVEGKYVNEVKGGSNVSECNDEKYLDSIIKVIQI